MPLITVFTPTYNRAYTLASLYESLLRQSYTDFEWVVVNDGSTDCTDELFDRWQAQGTPFSITYVRTDNGGKHRAINRGVALASGEMFFIVDSDDYLTDTALARVAEVVDSIPPAERESFAGVCGNKGYTTERPVGTVQDTDAYLDITSLERVEHGITGDKAEVFYTSLLRRYPFPEFEGERFLTECVVWDKMANDGYKLRFFNEIVYICEYLPDGLSNHSDELFLESPKGFGLYLSQSARFGKISGRWKWEQYSDYYHLLHGRISLIDISRNLNMNPIILVIGVLGLRLYHRVRGW